MDDQTLAVLDLEDTLKPALLSTVTVPFPIIDFAFRESTVVLISGRYSSRWEGKLSIIDVSNLALPAIKWSLELDVPLLNVHLANGFAIVPSKTGMAFDVSNPNAPPILMPALDFTTCGSLYDGVFFYQCSTGPAVNEILVIESSNPPHTGASRMLTRRYDEFIT